MKRKIFAILLLGVMVLGMATGCDSKKEAEKDLQDAVEKYGFVDKETVEVLVAKFNTEVMDNSNGEMNPASDDYLVVDNNMYWYGLIEGIYLVVEPVEFSDDKSKEIVDSMTIFVENGAEYEKDAINYVKYLLKANYNQFSDKEMDSLIEDAKKVASKDEMANNGKGISVGFNENEGNYQYLVQRLYK